MRNYTLQELANRAGFTRQHVRNHECLSVDKTPTHEALAKFANSLDIDVRQLFDNTNDNSKSLSLFLCKVCINVAW